MRQRRWWLGTAIITLTWLSSAWWMVGRLLGGHHDVIGAPPTELRAEEVTLASRSGATLRGWYAPGMTGQGAVLLLHGVHADRRAMLPRALWLHSLGYAVLLIDFQAAGESTGDIVTIGLRESQDATSALAWLRDRAPGDRIGIIGTSMGGAAVLLAQPPLRVDAMVLEQVYPDVRLAVRDRLERHVGSYGAWMTPMLLNVLHWKTGIDPTQLRPIDGIGRLASPTLLIAGSDDEHTRLDESLAMYAAAGGPKSLWVVPGARHVDLYRYDVDAYRKRVGAFLAEALRASRSSETADLTRDR